MEIKAYAKTQEEKGNTKCSIILYKIKRLQQHMSCVLSSSRTLSKTQLKAQRNKPRLQEGMLL